MVVQPAYVKHGLRAPRRAIRYSAPTTGAETPAESEQVPVVLQQTDVVADHVNNTACSGLTMGGATANVQLAEMGIAGTTNRVFNVTTATERAHLFMGSAMPEPRKATWDSGTWTVRVRIWGDLAAGAIIRSCYICRVTQFGATVATVGSVELSVVCTSGVKSWTVEGSEVFGSVTDRILIVIGIRSTLGTVTVRVRPDQKVDTPILKAA